MDISDRVIIEEVEKNSEEMDDCEFERQLKCLPYEDRISKRKERDIERKDKEFRKSNWNGNHGSAMNDNQEHLGRGHMAQNKKGHS